MSQRLKHVLIGVASAVFGIFALALIGVKMIFAVIVGIIIGIIVAATLIAQSRGEKPRDVMEEVAKQAVQTDPDVKERLIFESLTRLNQLLRTDAYITGTVVEKCEELIDVLQDVASRAQQEVPYAEVTFDLVEMATNHLPEYFDKYLKTSVDDRDDEKVLARLNELLQFVLDKKEKLDQGNLDAFTASDGFVDVKFGRK
ncbi:MAG: hypothetical protein CR972_03625 [Candidatus Moraniibacteriota bacterium]|nr:MAG: hypothetical protein CR972_03625 [Candidatus Moranbacteria bacterium]